jgi:uncharacterized protein YbbC (DUF1343 family)
LKQQDKTSMRKLLFILPITVLLLGFTCIHKKPESHQSTNYSSTVVESSTKVGASHIELYLDLLKGKKVGVLVNQTSMLGETHLVDTLLGLGVNIVTIFAPEHGFRGDHSAGAHVENGKDQKTGLKITSLYGKNRKPSAEMLQGLDYVLFDIQDVGVRFYTYISSMHYMMEACNENKVSLIILDRPNPNGYYIDGPTLEPKFKSFIGMHEVPLVHGMTVGEFATMIVGEKWIDKADELDLKVIKCSSYSHSTLYQLPVRPSPNLPNMQAVYLYPSLGLFEGTNVSVGRGTDFPFQVLGRPGLPNGSILFTPESIPGVSDHPKHEGKECRGVMLREFANTYLLDNKQLYLDWLFLFQKTNDQEQNGPYFKSFFDKLAGTTTLRKQIESNTPIIDIRKSWQTDIDSFKLTRKKYLLYYDFE